MRSRTPADKDALTSDQRPDKVFMWPEKKDKSSLPSCYKEYRHRMSWPVGQALHSEGQERAAVISLLTQNSAGLKRQVWEQRGATILRLEQGRNVPMHNKAQDSQDSYSVYQ